MSKAAGVALIFAGVGLASSLLLFGAETEVGTSGVAVAKPQAPAAPRMAATMFVPAEPAAAGSGMARPQAAPRPQKLEKLDKLEPPETPAPPVVVTITHRNDPAPAPPQAARQPADRVSLAQGLQRELKRVGCYAGELNGMWTTATRKAMKAFTDQVNATLPVADPDPILLSLVQSHKGQACGRPCPAAQGLSEDGRCVPTALLAQAARKPATEVAPSRGRDSVEKPAPAIAGWTTTTSAVVPAPPGTPLLGERMALAGPSPNPSPNPGPNPSPEPSPAATEAPSGLAPVTEGRNKRSERGRARDERRGPVQRASRSGGRLVESLFASRRWTN